MAKKPPQNKISLTLSRASGYTTKIATVAKHPPSQVAVRLAELLIHVLTVGDDGIDAGTIGHVECMARTFPPKDL